jgi:hypothetical protein
MELLAWVESWGISTFVRENPSFYGYPTFLFAHTFGLSIVVGMSSVVAARILGLGAGLPIGPLARLFPVMWGGFLVNLISGTGLYLADAVNKTIPGDGRQAPVFLTKLAFVVAGGVLLWLPHTRLATAGAEVPEGARMFAALMLVCWVGAMISGRLIGYSSAIFSPY